MAASPSPAAPMAMSPSTGRPQTAPGSWRGSPTTQLPPTASAPHARRLVLKGCGAWVTLTTLSVPAAPAFALASAAAPEGSILLTLPDLVDNGAVVPVSIVSRLPGTTSIALFADANPVPLVAQFDIAAGTAPAVSLRIRLAQSGVVRAEVTADGHRHVVQRQVEVQIGGCS